MVTIPRVSFSIFPELFTVVKFVIFVCVVDVVGVVGVVEVIIVGTVVDVSVADVPAAPCILRLSSETRLWWYVGSVRTIPQDVGTHCNCCSFGIVLIAEYEEKMRREENMRRGEKIELSRPKRVSRRTCTFSR